MQRSVALARLRRVLGDKLGYRIDPEAPTREEREAADAELGAALDLRKSLREKRDARRDAVLAADDAYKSLNRACEDIDWQVKHLSATARRHKITVGMVNSLFFTVKAEGDSWEEVIAKLNGKSGAAA